MTGPELVYLLAVGIYFIFFLLFSRYFFWKRYSETRFWNKRPNLSLAGVKKIAAERKKQLPFFSILIPARNEAEVIEKTIRHMTGLKYDPTRFEVIVVTDAKERQKNVLDQKEYILDTVQFLEYALRGDWKGPLKPHVQELVVGLLADLCLAEYKDQACPAEPWLVSLPVAKEPVKHSRVLLYELTSGILKGNGKISLQRVYRLFRRYYPHLQDKDIVRIYPNYLCLAVPIVQLYAVWTGNDHGALMQNLVQYSARANHRITQEIVSRLAAMVGDGVERAIIDMQQSSRLKEALVDIYDFCFPTTQQIVEQVRSELQDAPRVPVVKHIEVPEDFDGQFGGKCLGKPVPSTKGRALNYALPLAVDERTVMYGFYDAESRPDPDVLLYVAYRLLTDEKPVRIFQGPAFQVRNFYDIGPLSKLASLYQTVSHDWYLPIMFRRLPFVGGTNLFIERDLLDKLGGYDSNILTEDLELGTRAYLETGAWPEYLPYPSSEQTPATVKGFYRQRLRWGTGFLQVMDKISQDDKYPQEKKRPLMRELWLKGPIEWSFFQFATLIPPVMMVLWLFGQVDVDIIPNGIRHVIRSFSVIVLSFTFYAYFRYRKHLDLAARPHTWPGRCAAVAQLLFLPLASFFFPVPFTSALFLKSVNKHPTAWTKTPRSKE
ncbi:MAG: glycosyltransferase [Firmicutes bacterium]|nr:glycosyltransferase [Bacillota bacterium]